MVKHEHRILLGAVILSCFLGLFAVQEGWTVTSSEGLDKESKAKVVETYLKLPLHFIKYEGQSGKKFKFYEKSPAHSIFFGEQGIYLTLLNGKEKVTMRQTFVNGKAKPEMLGEDALDGKVNYFIGNDKKKWKTRIPTYKAVRYKNIYENMDIKFYGNNRQLEYDIVVKPGANPSAVKFSCEGIDGFTVTKQGDLLVEIRGMKFIQKKPNIYQEVDGKKVQVEGGFKIYDDKTYGFYLSSYNREHPLIIDPVLIFSTYLGGSGNEESYSITVDTSGNAYLAGKTSSNDFPTYDPFQPNHSVGTNDDAFVTKINSAGMLVYSTYLGGRKNEYGYSISVDGSGNAYVAGGTSSTDFPTQNPLQPNHGGGTYDAFISKLNATGILVYSTYLGGSGNDESWGIAIDDLSYAFVTGITYSSDFPTKDPLQPSYGGYGDIFIAKINAAGTIVYSTYLGGSDWDFALSIAVDDTGNAYLTGGTSSNDFPIQDPLQPDNGGYDDIFVVKINTSGNALVYSTYLGGSENEYGYSIVVDASGNVYLAGKTSSTDFPTHNPLQPNHGGGTYDAFVTKLNSTGAIVYSTYLGGSGNDEGYGIAVDRSGHVFVTGITSSDDFPMQDPVQPNTGGWDAFVTKINAVGALLYSTYLGGSDWDCGWDIALDDSGCAYVVGGTSSTDFPTHNPLQPNHGGGTYDAFITKITEPQPDISISPTSFDFGPFNVGISSPPRTLTVTNTGTADLVIGTITLTGANASEFSKLNDTCSGHSIAPSNSCTIQAVFSPTSAGAKSANLSIPSNDPDTPILNILLSGTGITEPIISVSPVSHNFGNVQVGSSPVAQTFTISSTGTADLIIGTINLTGTNGSEFSKLNDTCSGHSIAPSNSCTIQAVFSPTSAGAKSANLSIPSNDPDTPILNILLSGTGFTKTPVECQLVPNSTYLLRGATLGLWATVTNNTSEVQVFQFATKVTLPNGNGYPLSGFLYGPKTVTLNPHSSKTGYITHTIPFTVPTGIYTYHGYVGTLGMVLIDECQFYFTVSH